MVIVEEIDYTKPRVDDIPLHLDDRGSVYCVFDYMNSDWNNIKRSYVVRNWQVGTVRAWHGHKEAATHIHVIKGTAKIAAKKIYTPDAKQPWPEPFIVTLSAAKPQLFYVPPGWYNGTMTLQEDTRILIFSTLSFNEIQKDNFRQDTTKEEMKALWKVANR